MKPGRPRVLYMSMFPMEVFPRIRAQSISERAAG
jgi:hypothetical protein